MKMYRRTKAQFDEYIDMDIKMRKWFYRMKRMELIKDGVLKIAPSSDGNFIHIYVHGFSCACFAKNEIKERSARRLIDSVVDTIGSMRLGIILGKENKNE